VRRDGAASAAPYPSSVKAARPSTRITGPARQPRPGTARTATPSNAVDAGVGDPESDVATVVQPLRDEVLEHLVLGVDRHGSAARGLEQVDPVHLPAEGQVDAVVDEPVAAQPIPHPGRRHQVHRALLQHTGLDRLLDVLTGA
jgi:hypothetical protein